MPRRYSEVSRAIVTKPEPGKEQRRHGPPAAATARTGKFRQRQEEIVRSAVDVINHKGVKGMTLAGVAASLDIVPTGIIYYFANKELLAAECFLRAIDAYNQLIGEAAGGSTPRARLRVFVERYFEFRRQVASGATSPIAFFNDVRALGDPRVNEAYTDMFRRARALFEPLAMPDADRPALNAHTHHVLSQLYWAVAWLPQYDPDDYGRAGDRVGDILERGVHSAGQAWRPRPLSLPQAEATEEASRQTFLRAATELINEQGYLGASVEKISARLNVTKGSFYHHHETKDDLVVACFERTVDIMRSAQRAADRLPVSGWDRLCSTSAALVELQVSGGAPLLRTSALTSVPEAIRAQLITKFNRVSGYFAAMISDGIADGSIRPIDASICAQMITGMLNAAAELRFWAPGLAATEAGGVFLQPLFQGLGAGPQPARPG